MLYRWEASASKGLSVIHITVRTESSYVEVDKSVIAPALQLLIHPKRQICSRWSFSPCIILNEWQTTFVNIPALYIASFVEILDVTGWASLTAGLSNTTHGRYTNVNIRVEQVFGLNHLLPQFQTNPFAVQYKVKFDSSTSLSQFYKYRRGNYYNCGKEVFLSCVERGLLSSSNFCFIVDCYLRRLKRWFC